MRVLVMSHADPRVSRGGAEISAFQMYEELRRRPNTRCFFISASGGRFSERLGVRLIQPFGVDEYVYVGHAYDHYIHSNPDAEFPDELMRLLGEMRPDVIHLHHYANFGVEVLLMIRRALPDVRVVLTLHEYLAICNHFGQMVKRPNFALCYKSGQRDCARCFPDRTEQDFFLRDLFIKRFFRLVDHFVAPSRFLADRYVAWGLDPARVSVVENGMPVAPHEVHADPFDKIDSGLVIGFFGQISRLKGIGVLFDAAKILADSGVTSLRIDVHGDASSQPPEFRKDFEERLAVAPDNIRYCGAYDNTRVHRLMRSVHAVIVPSIWWENSPLVIQEALLNRRPVICSDIGGMAEKVRDGVDGFHFQAGSGWALAALLKRLALAPQILADLRPGLAVPPSIAETTTQVLALYASLLANPLSTAQASAPAMAAP
ncbi:glycosyltransferase [Falsiroseomonas sp. HC035]|uniref:glycosyltransferase n=1 Tax=Falsiroseomonas sp. HC035 TaxID=3390999 RepID=UPI003D31F170